MQAKSSALQIRLEDRLRRKAIEERSSDTSVILGNRHALRGRSLLLSLLFLYLDFSKSIGNG